MGGLNFCIWGTLWCTEAVFPSLLAQLGTLSCSLVQAPAMPLGSLAHCSHPWKDNQPNMTQCGCWSSWGDACLARHSRKSQRGWRKPLCTTLPVTHCADCLSGVPLTSTGEPLVSPPMPTLKLVGVKITSALNADYPQAGLFHVAHGNPSKTTFGSTCCCKAS